MLGYRRDEILGLNIQSLIDQAELPTTLRRLQERGVGEIVNAGRPIPTSGWHIVNARRQGAPIR